MEELVQIGQRVEIYMKAKGIGINQLGRLTNTSGTQVLNIINGKKYGIDKVYALLKALPDLNPNWLLFGEGEMLKQFQAISELELLSQNNEALKKEIQNLKAMLSYQELAIEAYRKSFDVVNTTNDDLKKTVELYKASQGNH